MGTDRVPSHFILEEQRNFSVSAGSFKLERQYERVGPSCSEVEVISREAFPGVSAAWVTVLLRLLGFYIPFFSTSITCHEFDQATGYPWGFVDTG
jgi:hypothetical protein